MYVQDNIEPAKEELLMLFEALGKLKHQIIISSVVMMILGLLMLIIPEQYDGILVHVLGYTAILLGAVMVWDFIGGNRKLKDFILMQKRLILQQEIGKMLSELI